MKKKIFSILFYVTALFLFLIYIIMDSNSIIQLTEFGRLFLLCGSCLFLYFGGFLLSKYKNNNKPMKINLWVFFILYLLLLITLTLFDSNWGRNGINLFNTTDYKQYFENTVNLVPFKTISMYLRVFDSMYSTSNILFNLLGNLIAFAPFAFFLPLLFEKQNKFKNFLLTTTGIILSVEIIQLITASGRFDIDDLILNLSGSLILYGIIKIKSVNKLIRNIFLLEKNKISKKSYIRVFSSLLIFIAVFLLIVMYRNKLYNDNMNDYYNKYNPTIKIVDESVTCDDMLDKFYEDDLKNYYFPCKKSDYVYAIINGKEKYLIKEILNTENFEYNIDIYRIKNLLDFYKVNYIEEDKYNKINFNIDISDNNGVFSSPEQKVFISNENILEVKFDIKNSNIDVDNHKYNIDLYLIPKSSGTTNIEVIFKDYDTLEIIKYLYKVTVDDDLKVNYYLLNDK